MVGSAAGGHHPGVAADHPPIARTTRKGSDGERLLRTAGRVGGAVVRARRAEGRLHRGRLRQPQGRVRRPQGRHVRLRGQG